jgi:hypothetical protein
MTEPTRVAVPRKGRPLEAVLERLASVNGSAPVGGDTGPTVTDLADEIISTLRYEKAIAKGNQTTDTDVYARLAEYSDLSTPHAPEFTLLRDDRPGLPRRVVFDSLTLTVGGQAVQLVGREEPFRAIRTHEFALGFDSADLVLEEVVALQPTPLARIADLNARIDPRQTDVRVVAGLGDTVYHTLLGTPNTLQTGPGDQLDRSFVDAYQGPLCISPRYERLVTAVLGTDAVEDVTFRYPDDAPEEEAAIAEHGLGVYLTMTGSTAREHGLVVGERLFPSETVLMENVAETNGDSEAIERLFVDDGVETALAVS